MSEIKKIILKILVLGLDILLFASQTVKQIILPNRRRKGNILSSVLDLFIGSIERLIQFEHGIFRMNTLFRHKYCKQCLIVITTLLFLISSFERTGLQINNNETNSYSQQVSGSVAERITVNNI